MRRKIGEDYETYEEKMPMEAQICLLFSKTDSTGLKPAMAVLKVDIMQKPQKCDPVST